MRNRFNVIQINGIKGIFFLIGAGICLVAGFIVFPGIVLKSGWNFISEYVAVMPKIGLLQGLLLWGITVVSYFTFKKKGFFVEFKSAQELSGEELDAVMHKIRADRRADIITKSIIRAQELEAEARTRLDKFESSNKNASETEQSNHIENSEMAENTKN